MANYILGTLAGIRGGRVISGSLTGLTGTLTASSANVIISGSLAGLEGLLDGGQKYTTLSGELAGLDGAIAAYTNRFGQLSGELAGLDGSIAALSGNRAAISGVLSGLSGEIVATPHKIAIISGTLTGLSGLITGYTIPVVTISGALAGLSGSIISLGTFHAICCSPLLRGVTDYTNFAFDSFFEHEGKYYGVTSAGIYLLEGTTDAGTAIAAYLESGKGDFGEPTIKNVRDVYALSDLNGTSTLNLKAEDYATGQTYTATGDGTLLNRKWRCSIGVQGQSWQWKISNSAGSGLSIRRLEFVIDRLHRR